MKRFKRLSNTGRWLCFSLALFLAQGLSAQLRTIAGTVSSAEGEPLIGATILVENAANRGTITDFEGRFAIEAETGESLLVSYTGYQARTVAVTTESTLDITLEVASELLDEIVVIGYGTQKKSDLTGAISSVSGDQLRSSITTNIDQALQGRVAGVQVTQNSGQPGGAASIRIRGANSITGSSEPLYVIDGIPFQGDGASVAGFDWAGGANGQNRVNPLSTINPNDIVRIEVLKDASATAIYGSRAANGVVLITTKRGEAGDATVSYNGFYANQSLPSKLEMMTMPDYASYQVQIANDLDRQVNQRYLDPSLLGDGTDWQDEVFRNAGMQSHQVSVSGGNDNTRYAVSGGYFQQDGIIIGSNFDRITTRINLDNQVNKWLKAGASFAYAKTNEKITLNDGGDGVIMQALLMPPDVPVRGFDGEYAGPSSNTAGISFNPVGSALLRNNTLARQRLMANIFTEVDLFKGLNLRSEIGFDDNHSLNKAFHPTFTWGALQNNENQLRQREENSFFWIWKNYMTYNTALGENHKITAMLGAEAQESNWEGSQVTKKEFSSNDIQVLSEGNDVTSRTSGWKGGATLASYFGRFNYSFDERYLLTLTMRADGSSKFGPNKKWGYFPSGSIAWRISKEEFMKSMDAIYNLKLRAGYGEVGNQAIGDYLYGSSLLTVTTPFGTGYRPEKIPNPDLKWEATQQFNVGMDLGMFDGRIDFTIDLYQKQTSAMLLQLSIPSYLGGTEWNDIRAPYANVGSLENKGFDLSLTTRNLTGRQFNWTTNLTFSRNENKILELDDDSRIYWRNLYWYSEFQTATRTSVGLPIGMFYGYEVEGLFRDQDDILNHAVQVSDGNISDDYPHGRNLVNKTQGVWPGDVKFKDLNGDGVVDVDDQTVIGDPNPDFTFGINNNFSYGPLDLTIYLNGSYGAEILNYSRVVIEGQTSVFNNQAATVADRAQIGLVDPDGPDDSPENVFLLNPDSDIPRPTTNDNNRNNRMSDRYIEDGSYLRIQNVRLSYTLPGALTRKARIERMKFYVNVQNLYTFTNYSGYDPEIGAFNQNPLIQNVDMGRYPSPRLITFGVDVDF